MMFLKSSMLPISADQDRLRNAAATALIDCLDTCRRLPGTHSARSAVPYLDAALQDLRGYDEVIAARGPYVIFKEGKALSSVMAIYDSFDSCDTSGTRELLSTTRISLMEALVHRVVLEHISVGRFDTCEDKESIVNWCYFMCHGMFCEDGIEISQVFMSQVLRSAAGLQERCLIPVMPRKSGVHKHRRAKHPEFVRAIHDLVTAASEAVDVSDVEERVV
jgi:hypothetical protein